MNKKSILIISTTIALLSIGFYFYRRRVAQIEYKKSVEQLTSQYNVFN